jgi:hypothetical protein
VSVPDYLRAGHLNRWLDETECEAVRLLPDMPDYTAREFARNAAKREASFRRLRYGYTRFWIRRVQRERFVLDWLARRFGLEETA